MQVRKRACDISFFQPHVSPVRESLKHLCIDRDGAIKVCTRSVQFSSYTVDDATVHIGDGQSWIDTQCRIEISHGIVHETLSVFNDAATGVSFRRERIDDSNIVSGLSGSKSNSRFCRGSLGSLG